MKCLSRFLESFYGGCMHVVHVGVLFLEKIYIVFGKKTIYRNRPISAKEVWVRSNLERKVANFFTRQKIDFRYEKRIILPQHETNLPNVFFVRLLAKLFCPSWKDAITLRPDFYLTNHNVFVEVCGMMHDPGYRRTMELKKALYSKNGVSVIYLYPRIIGSNHKLTAFFFSELQRLSKNEEDTSTTEQ